MPAGNENYFGIKVYSANPKSGAHFTFLLYRSEDGLPLASVDANALGQIRTGAASGLATKLLARKDASILGVIGSGLQAEMQVRAIASVRALKEVRVWSRNTERCKEFARRFDLPVRPVSTAQESVERADIVVTATSSKEPVLESAWIAPGTHINAMGSNWANRRELPSGLVHRADLVVVDGKTQLVWNPAISFSANFPEERVDRVAGGCRWISSRGARAILRSQYSNPTAWRSKTWLPRALFMRLSVKNNTAVEGTEAKQLCRYYRTLPHCEGKNVRVTIAPAP